ncbi:hypothetical protein [uncultured Roseibium sp.]|uniref:hypothetical protein n=1 Tax=uncultured Roseibium sp. TaxID=1936171 RepID=UPI0032179F6E
MNMITKLYCICLVFLIALTFTVVDASAGAHRITICNAISNAQVVSFSVKGGTVSGFEAIKPRKCQSVSVSTSNGECAAWAYAHISFQNATATGLINVCGGKYAVMLRTLGNTGTKANLNLVPIK